MSFVPRVCLCVWLCVTRCATASCIKCLCDMRSLIRMNLLPNLTVLMPSNGTVQRTWACSNLCACILLQCTSKKTCVMQIIICHPMRNVVVDRWKGVCSNTNSKHNGDRSESDNTRLLLRPYALRHSRSTPLLFPVLNAKE